MTDVDIVMIVDNSGSMWRIKSDAEGALNNFLDEQKNIEGDAFVTFVQFDHEYEIVFEKVELAKVKTVSLKPRGSTALLDAIGRTVVNYVPRTEKTIYVIMTDGQENCSQEWTNAMVKNAIAEATQHGDEFVYLGANQDAIEVGTKMGISVGSSLTFAADKDGLDNMSRSMTSYVTATRSGLAYEFTDEDRRNATGLTDSE
jgi:Mg-chelatase subunit ChlD